jgi:hypothetical protein
VHVEEIDVPVVVPVEEDCNRLPCGTEVEETITTPVEDEREGDDEPMEEEEEEAVNPVEETAEVVCSEREVPVLVPVEEDCSRLPCGMEVEETITPVEEGREVDELAEATVDPVEDTVEVVCVGGGVVEPAGQLPAAFTTDN